MDNISKFNDIFNSTWNLMEVLIQLHEFEEYILHLESHLDWPRRIEIQLASKRPQDEHQSEIERIEHKYAVILPMRQQYSYVLQFTAILESSMKRVLNSKHIQIPKKPKFNQLVTLIGSLNVEVPNKSYLFDLYRFRNQIAHSNGLVLNDDIKKWNKNRACNIFEQSGEAYLKLELPEFFSCLEITWRWIAICCKAL